MVIKIPYIGGCINLYKRSILPQDVLLFEKKWCLSLWFLRFDGTATNFQLNEILGANVQYEDKQKEGNESKLYNK